jgi:hypothetical protein
MARGVNSLIKNSTNYKNKMLDTNKAINNFTLALLSVARHLPNANGYDLYVPHN